MEPTIDPHYFEEEEGSLYKKNVSAHLILEPERFADDGRNLEIYPEAGENRAFQKHCWFVMFASARCFYLDCFSALDHSTRA